MNDINNSVMAEQDFFKARRKAAFSSIFSLVSRKNTDMLSFEEVRALLKPTDEAYKGYQTIKIADIVGSEGRYRDFDRRFLPRTSSTKQRWQRIWEARDRDINLPPILVYELGGVYFIRDGNHRVSVAKQLGGEYIEAEVTRVSTRIEVGQVYDRDELKAKVIEYEQSRFMKALDLLDTFPQSELKFTATGRYDDLVLHVACHKQSIEDGTKNRVTYAEAAESWYKTIYLPTTKLIRDSGVLVILPNRTEADFYVWLIRNWEQVSSVIPAAGIRHRRTSRRFASNFS